MYRIRHNGLDVVVGVRGERAAAGVVRNETQFAPVVVQISNALNASEEAKP